MGLLMCSHVISDQTMEILSKDGVTMFEKGKKNHLEGT